MSRISEVAAYAMFSLEMAINKCALINQPISAEGVAGILEDIRLLKCGLLDRNEALSGGRLSNMAVAKRVILRVL